MAYAIYNRAKIMGDKLFDGVSIVALLGLIGAAFRWVWTSLTGRADKRESDMDMREAKFTAEQERRIASMEAEMAIMRDDMNIMRSKLNNQRSAIHILVVKVMQDEPTASELRMVELLLGEDYPMIGDK